LIRAELALAQLSDGLPPFRQLKIGEVARWTRHDCSVLRI
jgi:hypothetical protein